VTTQLPDHVAIILDNAACLTCKVAILTAYGPVLLDFLGKHQHAVSA